MKIALGADHAGFELKENIRQHLAGIADVQDFGTSALESVDYPDFARAVAEAVAAHQADRGILFCGTGIGMAIAANKVPGIRAANVNTESEAKICREHNDTNVLTVGGRLLDAATASKIVDTWLETAFAGGRHQRRIDKIAAMEMSSALRR